MTDGATTTGINAGLALGGGISGTVVADGGGSPLAGICLSAFLTTGEFVSSGSSAGDGTYSLPGLAGGNYRIRFSDCVNPVDYAMEHFDNKADFSSANSVTVTPGATTPNINAGLGIAGAISGTVVADGTGAPVAGLCVSPVFPSGSSSSRFTTAADGTYVMTGLFPGTYKVRFHDCAGTVDWALEYYEDRLDFTSGNSVTVTAGVTTSGINASVGLAGNVSGTVVADGSGTPLAGICVSPFVATTGSSNFQFTTAADGTYLMTGLAAGTYRVRFQDCAGSVDYATEYYDNKQGSTAATTVTVTAGATLAGVNAGLAVGGSISGTVIADGTGNPLSGICAGASLPTNGDTIVSATTGASGTYLITGLAAGTYKVRFQDCVGSVDYALEYHQDKVDLGSGNAVAVNAGATTSGINGSLGIAGAISGTVVADGTGAPVAGICVSPQIPSSGSSNFRFNTAADGTYLMNGLAPGTYRVRFQDCSGTVDWATEYYDNKLAQNAANLVTVAAGATTTGVNASLGAAGSVSGTVVADGTGSPLAGICATTYLSTGDAAVGATTGADGTYFISGAAAGSYKIRFSDCVGSVDYAWEVYDNKLDIGTGASVAVTAGATTAGINASLGFGGSLAGTVVADGTGSPLAGICVTPVVPSTGGGFRFRTVADGTYLIQGLAPGPYKVRFQDCEGTVDYRTEYYDNKPDVTSANSVSVTAGVTTTGINAGLAPTSATKKPADFDGDGDTDRSVYRAGAWFAEGQGSSFIGNATDIPVPGDYDNDGDADRAVYRNGVWFTQGQADAFLGLAGDIPVPGDFNGDGRAERAVFRPSVGAWYVEGQDPVYFGRSGDIPVPGDYDGNGSTDIAIFRPEVGGWYIKDQPTVFTGLEGDIPVPGDYDGSGTTDIAIFRPAVGGWYTNGQATVYTGLAGDVPVPGDYDGNGTMDRGIWRKAVGGWYVNGQTTVFLGLSGDIPLPLPQAVYRTFFTP